MPVSPHPKAEWPGVEAFYGRTYEGFAKECEFLFDYSTSDRSRVELQELTGFGYAPQKTSGGPTTYDNATQSYGTTLYHSAYSLGYIITREQIDDDQYGVMSEDLSTALAFSMHSTWEVTAANIYNRAGTAGYTIGDGQTLLSTDHPTAAGNQSNTLAVDADLSEASLEDLLIQVGTVKNQRGLPIQLMPKCLIVPVNNSFEATRILESQLRVGTANNDVNAIRQMGAFPEGVKVSHYITDTDSYFIRTNAPKSMVGYTRTAMEFTQDNDFDTDNAKAKAYFRKTEGVGDWRGLFGNMGAA